ncbi:hypothetical protein U14_02208 [Candidatus Moduliflexus flocculans]|uniref:ROK family protein n=1 Tax=Candidatus Moduliflexus flocculans TaxID=1499966 RepID=A0A0S6VZG5_9BACT|nr:hypothetical protein U14_02208 [Candidatus Moduliflexus flocculans]
MNMQSVIGVDLGGTNVRTGAIREGRILKHFTESISANADAEIIIHELIDAIEHVFQPDCAGIGIGVPGVVEQTRGIIYDIENIPSWKEVPLREIVEQRFHVPVAINNDANCFALGEASFGKGQAYRNFVGVTLGTGIGTGIIINRQLYSGVNCGAGELGILPYIEHDYEYYCGGQFFEHVHHVSGKAMFEAALRDDADAKKIFDEYGGHLGNALWVIVAAFAPELIVLGGSISQAFPFFQQAIWSRLAAYPFRPSVKNLVIEPTNTPNIALLGAAALCEAGKQ